MFVFMGLFKAGLLIAEDISRFSLRQQESNVLRDLSWKLTMPVFHKKGVSVCGLRKRI